MKLNFYRVEKIITILLCCLWIMSSCGERDKIFVAEVVSIDEPKQSTDIELEKVETDEVYSFYFSVYDSLLISSRPNSKDCFFDVANIKNDELLGSFLHCGQGPSEYFGLNPVKRIEKKGDDLVTLTYEPSKRELIEWNITKSIESGKDSVLLLGIYKNPGDFGLFYRDIYKIGASKYLGHTSAFIDIQNEGQYLLPTFWIFDGCESTPERSISIVKKLILNKKSKIDPRLFFEAPWGLKPDNSKIITAMCWLKQINIIDLESNEVSSYRVKESQSEDIFYSSMEDIDYYYHDLACNDNVIYALYFGDPKERFGDVKGCYWLHEYDWDGNLKNKYKLSTPIFRLWLDPSSDTLYGYSEPEDAIYKLIIPQLTL